MTTISSTPTRHKWADILVALAEGKQVQSKQYPNETWDDWPHNKYHADPLEQHNLKTEWRIKPEKKTGWINIYSLIEKEQGTEALGYCVYPTKESADKAAGSSDRRIACIQIEYIEGEGL